MLGFPKRLMYAIEAVVDIAYNAGGEPVQSSAITLRQGIPKRYLEPVMQQLVRAGILVGVRGPRGGYRLARERRRISLGDIIRVVQSLEEAEAANDPRASELGRSVVRPLWNEIQEDWMKRLDGMSIEDVCLRARKSGVPSDAFQKLDYTI